MKDILFNLALIDTMNFCKGHGIDCSGTHLYKHPRGFTYSLKRDKDGVMLVTTTFNKSSVPTHSVNPSLI